MLSAELASVIAGARTAMNANVMAEKLTTKISPGPTHKVSPKDVKQGNFSPMAVAKPKSSVVSKKSPAKKQKGPAKTPPSKQKVVELASPPSPASETKKKKHKKKVLKSVVEVRSQQHAPLIEESSTSQPREVDESTSQPREVDEGKKKAPPVTTPTKAATPTRPAVSPQSAVAKALSARTASSEAATPTRPTISPPSVTKALSTRTASSGPMAIVVAEETTALEKRLATLLASLETSVCARLAAMEEKIATMATRCDTALETASHAAADAHSFLDARVPELNLPKTPILDEEEDPVPRAGAPEPLPSPKKQQQPIVEEADKTSEAAERVCREATAKTPPPSKDNRRTAKPIPASLDLSPDVVDVSIDESPVKQLFERNNNCFKDTPKASSLRPSRLGFLRSNLRRSRSAPPRAAPPMRSRSPSPAPPLRSPSPAPAPRTPKTPASSPPPSTIMASWRKKSATSPQRAGKVTRLTCSTPPDPVVAAHLAMKALPKSPPPPPTTRVPSDAPTIQSAIDITPPGGRVLIASGTYHERLVVSRAVELVGEVDDKAGDDGVSVFVEPLESSERALLVTASGVLCARRMGFRCAPCGKPLRPCAAVGVKSGSLELVSCVLGSEHALSGVNAQRGATLRMRNVRAVGCTHTGALVSGRGTRVEIQGGEFASNGSHGLEVQDGATLEAIGLILRNNAFFGAFVSDEGTSVHLEACQATDNKRCGVWVQSGARAAVERSKFANNFQTGLAISEQNSRCELVDCDLRGNAQGAFAFFNGAQESAITADDACIQADI